MIQNASSELTLCVWCILPLSIHSHISKYAIPPCLSIGNLSFVGKVIVENKLKEIGKSLEGEASPPKPVTRSQGSDAFGREDAGNFEVIDVTEECNK